VIRAASRCGIRWSGDNSTDDPAFSTSLTRATGASVSCGRCPPIERLVLLASSPEAVPDQFPLRRTMSSRSSREGDRVFDRRTACLSPRTACSSYRAHSHPGWVGQSHQRDLNRFVHSGWLHLRGFKSSAPPFSHLLMDSRPDRSFCIMNVHSVSSRVGLNDPQC
jgi:hypothetical protein